MTNPRTGYILMHRGWMDNPALGQGREPHNRRSAWAWLIENAAWRDTSIDVNGVRVAVRRGQLCASYRTLAREFGWTLAVVQRFIDRLKTDTMIDTATDTGRLILTICNYDRYQTVGDQSDTPDDTPGDTAAIHERYTGGTQKEDINTLRQDSLETTSPVGTGQPDLLGGATVHRFPASEVEAAVSAWNEMAAAHGLANVRTISKSRRQHLVQRLREAGGIEGWKGALQRIASNPFFQGENDRGWRADFDFLLTRAKFTKLMEGGYDRSARRAPARKGDRSWMVDRIHPAFADIADPEAAERSDPITIDHAETA